MLQEGVEDHTSKVCTKKSTGTCMRRAVGLTARTEASRNTCCKQNSGRGHSETRCKQNRGREHQYNTANRIEAQSTRKPHVQHPAPQHVMLSKTLSPGQVWCKADELGPAS